MSGQHLAEVVSWEAGKRNRLFKVRPEGRQREGEKLQLPEAPAPRRVSFGCHGFRKQYGRSQLGREPGLETQRRIWVAAVAREEVLRAREVDPGRYTAGTG